MCITFTLLFSVYIESVLKDGTKWIYSFFVNLKTVLISTCLSSIFGDSSPSQYFHTLDYTYNWSEVGEKKSVNHRRRIFIKVWLSIKYQQWFCRSRVVNHTSLHTTRPIISLRSYSCTINKLSVKDNLTNQPYNTNVLSLVHMSRTYWL